MYSWFCSRTCCLHLCKQGAERVIRRNTGEGKRAEQVLATQQKNQKTDGISASAQLCLHFQIMNKKEQHAQ